ncbi:MAG: 50S ribosomal protein L23 [Puniceicoccales bacterium]|jgi:large subunit ribosomal protein L23|nr:50S ribosomal protein L23 [Puniceicoccales bacterium]
MSSRHGVLKYFKISEKASRLAADLNQYTFAVDSDASAVDVARAITREFGYKPLRVNLLNQRGKLKRVRAGRRKTGITRKPAVKRAIVLLRDGDKIEIL